MCNDYRNRVPVRRLIGQFGEIKIPLCFPNGIPNVEPRDDIKITDRAPIIRPDGDGARLDVMRWSWPSPKGAPGSRCTGSMPRKVEMCCVPYLQDILNPNLGPTLSRLSNSLNLP